MTTTLDSPRTSSGADWLRLTLIGIGLAVVGLVMMGSTMLFTTTTGEGHFRYAADYVLTGAALPQGVGLLLVVLGVHRLQRGRDGRLGTIGVWVYGLCMAELVAQCMASVAARSEIEWGPAYPICAFGLMIGLALLAAGSWRVGLLPTWMLGLWPPLGLVGSFLGIGPLPFAFLALLVAMAIVLPRRAAGITAR